MAENIDFLEKLAVAKDGKRPVPPLPKGRTAVLTKADDVSGNIDSENDEVGGLAWFIEYEDSSGDISERRITIRSVFEKSKVYYINAFCHERGAFRQFRLDRVVEATDLATGEVLDDYPDIEKRLITLAPEGVEAETKNALRESKAALIILSYLSRCDGNYHPAEEDVIFKFIADQFFEKNLDEKIISKHIKRLYPHEGDFARAVKSLHKKDARYVSSVLKYSGQLIAADGFLDDKEVTAMIEVGGS